MIDYGFVLPKDQAKIILDAFNISANDYIDPFNGMEITYKGNKYLIMQRDVWFPPDTSLTTPDGWHIVYAPSEEEQILMEAGDKPILDAAKGEGDIAPGFQEVIDLGEKALLVLGLGIGVYALVNILGFLKTRRT